MAEARRGYRGYIGTRPLGESRTPQAVQNLVIRDYAGKQGLHYLLSSAEYIMPDCYMMLNQVLAELPVLEGVILYSLFMLPESVQRRRAVYARFLETGTHLHAALEGQAMKIAQDADRWEDIWRVQRVLPASAKAAQWLA